MTKAEMLEGYDNEHIFIGLFFAFTNRLQAIGDTFYEEITFKQFFLLICLKLFKDNPPTINELSDAMGSSHQNVKQIVLKLEKSGLVRTYVDPIDRRKIRIVPTEKIELMEEKYIGKEKDLFRKLFFGIDPEALKVTIETIEKIEQNVIHMKGKKK